MTRDRIKNGYKQKHIDNNETKKKVTPNEQTHKDKNITNNRERWENTDKLMKKCAKHQSDAQLDAQNIHKWLIQCLICLCEDTLYTSMPRGPQFYDPNVCITVKYHVVICVLFQKEFVYALLLVIFDARRI